MVEEFLDLPPRELPTDSRYVCDHSCSFVTAEPAMMRVCDCGKNAECRVCGYGWGTWPCDCDGIPIQRDWDWMPDA